MEEIKFGKKDMKCVHVAIVGKYINASSLSAENIVYKGELGKNVQEALDALDMHYVKYEELVTLIGNKSLVAGAKYRITDYVTTVGKSDNYISAENPFDIIVEAVTASTLSSHAKAAPHDGDTYFNACDLSKWELEYDINNDTTKYIWANSDGKGVIYYMKDDRENECFYDFKNIKVKPSSEDEYYFTFTLGQDDYSVSETKGCYNNIIKERRAFDTGCLHIPYIVIIAKGDNPIFNCIENTFGYDCYNIVIKEGAARNTFGSECFDIRCNYIGGSTFGNQCKRLYFNKGDDSRFGTYVSNFKFGANNEGSFEGIVIEDYNNSDTWTTVESDSLIKNVRFKSGVSSDETINIPETGNYVTIVERNKEGDIVVYTDNAGDVKKELDAHVETYEKHIAEFNNLINGNFEQTIDSFKEVIEFLKGVTDDETLTGKLNELKSEINDLEASDVEINADISDIYTRLTDITKDLQQGFEEIRNELGSEKNTREQADEEIKSRLSNVETSTSHNFHAIKELEGFVTESNRTLAEMLNQKQDTLVSGENIKTINGESILGEGNLVVNTKINPNLMMNTGFHGDITQVWDTDVKTSTGNPNTDVDGVRYLVLSNGQYIQQYVDCNPGIYTLSFRMKAAGTYVQMYLWDVANGYNVNMLAKSDEIAKRSGVGEYRIYTEGSEYSDYFITFEVGHSSPALEIKFGGNTNVPWVYISAIKLEEGDVVTQYVSHVDDYASAYGNSGGSFSGDAKDVTYSGNVNASNVKDAIDALSTTMITTEPAEGEEVTDYVLMASDVEQSLGDSDKPISQAAVKSAINSIESMIVSVITTPT